MATTFMLRGDSLVRFVDEYMVRLNRQERTRTDMIKDAGYINRDGKALYVDFYTELLNARGIKPPMMSEVNDAAYDELDDDTKALYDEVDSNFGEKWSHDQVMEFIEKLSDLDLDTVSAFQDYFYGVYDSDKEFAQEYYDGLGIMESDHPLYSFIDWNDVAHELMYDFDSFEFDYETYYFRN